MADTHRQKLGRWGEDYAAGYLESKGYNILARNWRTRSGEIDIIASADDVLAFVEVKTRRGSRFGLPEEAISDAKGERMLELGQEYVLQNDLEDMEWRVDLIAIELDQHGKFLRCEHIPNIVFGW